MLNNLLEIKIYLVVEENKIFRVHHSPFNVVSKCEMNIQ